MKPITLSVRDAGSRALYLQIYDNIKSGDSHGAYQALIEHSDLMIKDLLETIK